MGQHSQIFSPLVKEPIFFGSDLHANGQRRTEKAYLALYDAWRTERLALDASTHYFYSQNAATEIAAAAPEARVIAMVRNPIEATYSMFNQLRFNGVEALEDFSASLDAEADRAKNLALPKYGFAENFLYSRVYDFTANIRRFENAFGPERVKIVILDDLQKDPAGTVKQLCNFLSIDANEVDQFKFEVKNTASRVRFRWLNTLSVYPPEWLGYLSKPLLPQTARIKLRQFLGAKNTIPSKSPAMGEEVRQRLNIQFKPEIERLSRYLDRDLSHWS